MIAVDVIELSSDSEEESEDDCVMVPSTEEEEEEDAEAEDLNDGGAHINDEFNCADEKGRVLINVAHPSDDPDIFLSPQVAKVIKPHQVSDSEWVYDFVASLCSSLSSCHLIFVLVVALLYQFDLPQRRHRLFSVASGGKSYQTLQVSYNGWFYDFSSFRFFLSSGHSLLVVLVVASNVASQQERRQLKPWKQCD